MATLGVTFNFASDAESFSANAGSNCTLSWLSGDGNPAGSLQTVMTANNATNSSDWNRTLTWEDMGVPSNSVITGVSSASGDFKCTAGNRIGSCTAGVVDLVSGGSTITLAAATGFSATHASWQTANGTDASGLSIGSSSNATITINNTLDTTAGNGGTVTLLQDKITFTITYSAASSVEVSGVMGTVSVTGASGDVAIGIEPAGVIGAASIIGQSGTVSIGQVIAGIEGAISVTGYAGAVRVIDPIIARVNSTLDLQIAGELTESGVVTKKFYDSDGNLELVELIEGSTFFMDDNHKLTVVTFEESATIT